MVMQTQRTQGMSMMDDSLADLVRRRMITVEEAINRAADRSKFVVPA